MNDNEQTSHQKILALEMAAGRRELQRPANGLFWSGLAAGLEIGLSVLAIGIVVTLAPHLSKPGYELLRASAYSIGFIVVIFGRSELFTEHTTLAVLPVLGKQGTILQLVRLWGLILLANLIGGAAIAGVLAFVGPAMKTVPASALDEIAHDVLQHGTGVMFVSAVIAGWMMGLVSWLNSAGTETISRIAFTWLVTSVIGFAHLHHSVVGSVEVMAAWIAGSPVGLDYLRFLAMTVPGNAVGGAFFVAVVKFAHARPASAGDED